MRLFLLTLLSLTTMAQAAPQFTGLWWIKHGTGEPLQIRVYPDGTAWSDYPSNNPGRWETAGDRLICHWADGWNEILLRENGRWRKLGYEPGATLDGPPSNRTDALRASEAPDGWFGLAPLTKL